MRRADAGGPPHDGRQMARRCRARQETRRGRLTDARNVARPEKVTASRDDVSLGIRSLDWLHRFRPRR